MQFPDLLQGEIGKLGIGPEFEAVVVRCLPTYCFGRLTAFSASVQPQR